MALDNLESFASFVSQFTPIKILPWQEKKNNNNYDTTDNEKLCQEFEMRISKTFFFLFNECTREAEAARAIWGSLITIF